MAVRGVLDFIEFTDGKTEFAKKAENTTLRHFFDLQNAANSLRAPPTRPDGWRAPERKSIAPPSAPFFTADDLPRLKET